MYLASFPPAVDGSFFFASLAGSASSSSNQQHVIRAWDGSYNNDFIIHTKHKDISSSRHLRSVRNDNRDKPDIRCFNSPNHSVSDMKVCVILTHNGYLVGKKIASNKNDSFLNLALVTTHLHRTYERFLSFNHPQVIVVVFSMCISGSSPACLLIDV